MLSNASRPEPTVLTRWRAPVSIAANVSRISVSSMLLDAGRSRAQAEGHTIRFQEADAEKLPFPEASFDVVMSTFGVMFTPNQHKAASELARVCRPGGKIGLANWTPESFIGLVFKAIGNYVPPAAGVNPPSAWGTHARLKELFGETAKEIRTVRREFVF